MANTDYTPPHWFKKNFWAWLLGCGVVVLSLFSSYQWGVPFALHPGKPNIPEAGQVHADSSTSPSTSSTQEPGHTEIENFDFLREVDLFGTRCTVLRHERTAQRIVLLSGTQGDMYRLMYSRDLGVPEFSTLIPIFKSGTKFENSTIEVKGVAVDRQGQLEQAPYRMHYKHYVVSIMKDNKPQNFETYVGRIDENNQARALVLTFNEANYGTLEPFQDLLKQMKPTKS